MQVSASETGDKMLIIVKYISLFLLVIFLSVHKRVLNFSRKAVTVEIN